MKYYFTFLILTLGTIPCLSQVWSNNGAAANILSGTVISGGSLEHSLGTISNTGTLDLNDLDIQSGAIFTNDGTVKVTGNLSNAGTLHSTTGSIEIDGTGAQNITSTDSFRHLIINKTAGTTTLLSNLTVAGNLTFTAGSIATGIYTLILANGASVSGAGQSTGWVAGSLQKHFAGTSNTFEIGSSLYYAPASAILSGMAGAGSLIVSSNTGYHPSISSSDIISGKNINQYWTMVLPATNFVTASSASYTLSWNAADNYVGITPALEKGAMYSPSAGTWSYPTISGTPTTTGITVTGASLTGDFTVGERCDATFSYASPSYCVSGNSANIVLNAGAIAGTFTASPAGLTINAATGAVTVASSLPGTYTVTNTVTAACTATANIQVLATIDNNDLDYSNGLHGSVCVTPTEGGTATFTAPAGTVFINVGFASYGTPNGTCPAFTRSTCGAATSQSVVETYLLGNNSASIPATNGVFGDPCQGTVKRLYARATYTQSICAGSTPGTITGSAPSGGSGSYTYYWEQSTTDPSSGFSAAPGTNNTSSYIPNALAQNTWFRRTVASGNCSDVSEVILIPVSTPGVATISYSPNVYCNNVSSATITRTGTTGGAYSSTAGLTINAATGEINPSTSTPGSYTVVYTMANGGCTTTAVTPVTISIPPAATISYAGSPYCGTAGVVSVTHSGTTGGTYSSTAGLTINAASGAITPNSSSPGTYLVTYTMVNSACTATATTSVTITGAILASVIITPPTAHSICHGSNATFNAIAGNGGTTPVFQWKVNGVNVGTNSSAYSSTTLANGDVVTCVMTSNAFCVTGTPATSNAIAVSVIALPDVTNAATLTICSGSGTKDTLLASLPASFAWTIGNITGGITGASAGTGPVINQILTNPGITAGTVQYLVTPTAIAQAYSATLSVGNQSYPDRLGATFTVNTPVDITSLGIFDDSQNGLAGTLQVGIVRNSDAATMVGPISMTGSSDPLSGGYRIRAITPVTLPAGIYTVVTIGHSSSDKNGSTTIGGTGTLVNTGTGEISFNSSSYGGSGFGLPTTTYAGNNVFHAGTFGFTTGCAGATEAITVTVNPVPAATIAYAGSPYCNSGGTATVTFTGVAGGTYSSTAGLTINTSTGTVTPGSSTPGSYTVTYTLAAAGGCPLFTTTANIIIAVPGTWTGAVSTAWHTAGNWYCGSIPTISTDVIIATGLPRYPLVSSGTMTARNITIQTGASLTVTTILQIAGALSNAGTFTASNGTIELTGSSAQAIPASLFATNSIRNLTINNTAGVTLGGTLGVTGILKATTGSFNTGGYLTLISSATQTALIDGTGAGNVLGNVTMQRYLPSGFGYRYISSPFQAAKVSELGDDLNLNASFPPLYRYDENLAYAGWVKHIDTNGLLNPLAGYAVNFGAATPARTINMKGVVNNGSIGPATLYNHNRTYTQGFNLVGNPYPSPINWTAASGWTKTNIDNAIYYFNNGVADQYQGTYSSYINGVSSDGVASNTIPSMQGFFIHVSNGAYPVSATLSATNGVRVTTPNPTFHKVTNVEPYPMVRISAGYQDGAGLSDPTVVYFDPASSLAYNRELDALKMLNTDERVPSLYSLSASEKLSIHAIPANADTTLIIPLGIKTDKEGKVVFKARDIVELPAGLHPYFADAQNSAIQDLELIPEYGQVLGKGVHENRFYLIFARQLPAGIPGIKQALKAYSSGGSLFVYLPDAQGEIRIINTAGQLVKTETLSGAGYHQIRMEGASGLYLVSLSTAEGLVSGKVFVGQ